MRLGRRQRPGRPERLGLVGAQHAERAVGQDHARHRRKERQRVGHLGKRRQRRVSIEQPLALCQSDHLRLSKPAQAIKEIVLELVAGLPGNLLTVEESSQSRVP